MTHADSTGFSQRLDPAVMHVSCTQAGMLLARLGRPEVTNCVRGLEQYSHAYEEAGDHAQEMKRVHASVKAGDSDFSHMASVARGEAPVDPIHAMIIDPPDVSRESGVRPVHLVPVETCR
jgi:hypothetical protein